jgi:hypothetical protein
MHLEALIIKYTLGTMFLVVTLVFGVKIILLLSTVAKLKLTSFIGSLAGTPWDVIARTFETVFKGAVK